MGEFKKKTTLPPGPPNLKADFNCHGNNGEKEDALERWFKPSRLVSGYARIVLDAHTLIG